MLVYGKRFKNICKVIAALLISFLLEISIFNLKHWTTYFIGPILNASAFDTDINENINGETEFAISNINRDIRTVFLEADFTSSDIKLIDVTVSYSDENNRYTYTTQIPNGYEPGFYIPLGAMGRVKSLTVAFRNGYFCIQNIFFNKPLPFRFFFSRVFLLAFIISSGCFWKKERFGNIKYDNKSIPQKITDICLLSVYIGMLFFIMVFSQDFELIPNWNPTYGYGYRGTYDGLADAVLLGRLYLSEADESLINAAQPYSETYRDENNVNAPWDYVFYNGKIYTYFGIVPTLMFYLPFRLLVGVYPSEYFSVFVFSAIGAIGLYLLWKEIVKKYLGNPPYVIYSACLAAVLFGSNLLVLAVRAKRYEIAVSSAFMFSVWGLFFILRAVYDGLFESIKPECLFAGGLCLALAVGCRPTALLTSLSVPFLLIPALRSRFPFRNIIADKSTRKAFAINAASLAVPYTVIGCALMWYNYARFGSITEFGATYQISVDNIAALTQSGLLGNLRRGFDGIFAFLFSAFKLEPSFPFVYAIKTYGIFTGRMGRDPVIGLFALPISVFLPAVIFVPKGEQIKKAIPVIAPISAAGLLFLLIIPIMTGVTPRYTVDFYWLLIIPSMMCAVLMYEEALKINVSFATAVGRFILAAVGITIFIMTGWGTVGENNLIWRNNPAVIRFLSDFFSVI